MRSRIVFAYLMALTLLSAGVMTLIDLKDAKPENRVMDTDTTFSIAVFPDTQIYPMYYPDTFINMTEWVVEHRDEYNIKFVLHEGDITNNNNHPQWYNASRAMYVLNGSVPYTLNPGNHDLGPNGNAANRDTYLNDYFPSGPIENWTSWGGAFERGHQENTYHYFSAGGREWLVVALEFAPRDAVLEWANDVVESHPDRLVLVVTHNYLVANQRMTTLGGNYGVGNSPEGAASGEEIWQEFAKQHRNIMCVFSGHILQEWGWLVSNGMNLNPVYQMMVNFQMSGGGGQGFFRLLTFNMETETVHVETYSSLLDEVKTVPEHQFSFQFAIFDYVNDEPQIRNFRPEYEMYEDQEAGSIDLDGNQRPGSGIFYDPNVDQGDELDYYIFNGEEYQWVSLGNPMELQEADIFYMPNGTFKIVLPVNWFGTVRLLIEARDSRGGSIGTIVDVVVSPINDPPLLLAPIYWTFEEPIPDIKGDIIICNEDEELRFTIKGQDMVEPEDVLNYHMETGSSSEFSLDQDTGEFSFSPANKDVGDHLITFNVSDGEDIDSRDVLIRVRNVNDDPQIITSALQPANEDEHYWFQMEAVDIDPSEDELTWTLFTDTDFVQIDERTGNISATPGDDDVGNHYLLVEVEDGNGGEDSKGLNLKVVNINDPPFVSKIPSTLFLSEDTSIHFPLEGWFDDIDSPNLTYSAETGYPIYVEVLVNNTLVITPNPNWSGRAEINVTAFDGVESVNDILMVLVENVNDAPFDVKVELNFTSVMEGDVMEASASADDVDLEYDDKLFFAWFSNISGKLGDGNAIDLSLPAGHHFITMTVSDKAGEYVHYNFEVLVETIPTNDTIDDDDDTSGKEGAGLGVFIVVIAVPILILVLLGVGILSLYFRKRGSDTSEETNPNGDNPPVG